MTSSSFHRGNRRAGGALLWCLATIGVIALWGGLWWWVKYGTTAEELDPNRPRRLKVKASETKEGVYVHAKGVIRIVAGDLVEIHVRPQPDASLEMYAFALSTENWLTPEQEEYRKVGKKVSAGGKFVEIHRIAPEQVERARQLRFSEDLILTDEDRARLAGPFRKWKETSGAEHQEAEKVLLNTAKDVGAGAIAATKQALVRDIEQVPSLLTEEQWQKYLDLNLGK